MEKAYDVKALVAGLKGKGLDVAEDAAKGAVQAVSAWLTESVKISATPLDDIALVILPLLEEAALKELDKLDGKVG